MTNRLHQRDIVSIKDLDRVDIEQIIATAARIKAGAYSSWLDGRVIASCFYEPSTRTRLSFETAVQRLGGTLIGFADSNSTSAQKGESLSDTVRMIASYTDGIILRHPREGAARLASEIAATPVVNGGDGANQHPTQTLLDLFSLHECQGRLEGLTIALAGDLKYGRTVHSLAQACALFGCRFHFVAPAGLGMPDYILAELEARNIGYSTTDDLGSVIPRVDVLYMTRLQKERFDPAEYINLAARFQLNASMLARAPSHLRVFHPLPRVDEITADVDRTPHAYYFTQAENGVYVRMALLALMLNETLPEVRS